MLNSEPTGVAKVVKTFRCELGHPHCKTQLMSDGAVRCVMYYNFPKEEPMALPSGVVKKVKDCSKKNYRVAEDWRKGKRLGRPQQQFNEETKQWSKILLPKKVED
jgi:hypothetical protein